MVKTIPNDGLIRFSGFLNREHLLLTSPEMLSEVLVRHPYDFTKPLAARNLLRRFLGFSLVLAEGDQHKHLRKNMQPHFTFRKIQDLYPIFWSKAVAMTRGIKQSMSEEETGEVTVNVNEWASRATLDAIGRAVLGRDFYDPKNKNELLDLYGTVMSTSWEMRAVFIATAFLPRWTLKLIPGGIDKRITTANVGLRRAARSLLEERKKDKNLSEQSDILSQLITSNSFSDAELVDQIITLLAGGYDPTTTAFSWVIHFLTLYPEWQARLRSELRASIPSHYLSPTSTATSPPPTLLESLPVLNAVCNETFRFMPTTPITTRVAANDTVLASSPIPAGTKLFISPYVINRSTALYGSDAEDFNPRRWITDAPDTGEQKANNSGGASSNYAFLTFLHGPRKCIGHLYAKAEVRAFVAVFVSQWEFEAAKGEKVRPGGQVAVKPAGDLRVRMRPVVEGRFGDGDRGKKGE